MKASLITLLPLACFTQSALAAPHVAATGMEAAAGMEAKHNVSSHNASHALNERDLIGGLLGALNGLPLAPLDLLSSLPELGPLATLVTQVLSIVNSIGIRAVLIPQRERSVVPLTPLNVDGLLGGLNPGDLAGAGGGASSWNATGATGAVPNITGQLNNLQSTLQNVQGSVKSLAGSGGGALSLPLLTGVSVLLNRVFNAVATLAAQVTSLSCKFPSRPLSRFYYPAVSKSTGC
jgi:hypothetical protein